jgi:hypothetical protein
MAACAHEAPRANALRRAVIVIQVRQPQGVARLVGQQPHGKRAARGRVHGGNDEVVGYPDGLAAGADAARFEGRHGRAVRPDDTSPAVAGTRCGVEDGDEVHEAIVVTGIGDPVRAVIVELREVDGAVGCRQHFLAKLDDAAKAGPAVAIRRQVVTGRTRQRHPRRHRAFHLKQPAGYFVPVVRKRNGVAPAGAEQALLQCLLGERHFHVSVADGDYRNTQPAGQRGAQLRQPIGRHSVEGSGGAQFVPSQPHGVHALQPRAAEFQRQHRSNVAQAQDRRRRRDVPRPRRRPRHGLLRGGRHRRQQPGSQHQAQRYAGLAAPGQNGTRTDGSLLRGHARAPGSRVGERPVAGPERWLRIRKAGCRRTSRPSYGCIQSGALSIRAVSRAQFCGNGGNSRTRSSLTCGHALGRYTPPRSRP